MNIKENENFQKIINSQDLSLLQFCKLINNLLTDFNKKLYTKDDIISVFSLAYDNWIYQESMNEYIEKIVKLYLQALDNKVDEQILTAIVNSILNNLRFDSLKEEFLDLFVTDIMNKLNNEDLYSLTFINMQSSYFSALVKKYKYDDFTNTVNDIK